MGNPYSGHSYYPTDSGNAAAAQAKAAAESASRSVVDTSKSLTGEINADLAVLAVAIDKLHASMQSYAEDVTQAKTLSSAAKSEAYSAHMYSQKNADKLARLKSDVDSVTNCVKTISSNLTSYKNAIISNLDANRATLAEKAEVITNDISGVQNAIHDVDDLLNKHTILLNTLYATTAGLKPTLDDLVYRYTILQADLSSFSNRFDTWVDELGSQLNDIRDDLVNHMSVHAQTAHEERLSFDNARVQDEAKTRNTGAIVIGGIAALFSVCHMIRKVRVKTPRAKRVAKARETIVVEAE